MEEEKIKKSKDYFLPFSILIAAILIAGSLVYSAGKSTAPVNPLAADLNANIPTAKPDVSDAVWLGDSAAPVSIIEYGDFQCPVCGSFFSEVFPLLKKDYIDTGKVKMAYRDFVFLGPESLVAASAVHCAADQGKFWEYYNLIHAAEFADNRENNGNLTPDLLTGLAGQLNIDAGVFGSCLSGKKYEEKVLMITAQGQEAGVRATPTFFINDQKIEGLDSYDPYGRLKLLIDSELGEAVL